MKSVPPRANRVPLPITLTYRREGDDHWMQSRVANMSESGVLFGPTNLQPGAKVELITPEARSAPAPGGRRDQQNGKKSNGEKASSDKSPGDAPRRSKKDG